MGAVKDTGKMDDTLERSEFSSECFIQKHLETAFL
jgi:hypothetical protein